MTGSKLTVKDNMVVGLDYTLRLDDGEILQSSNSRGPLEFLLGHGQIVRGLERALHGMAVGDEKQVTVTPSEGYGELDPEAWRLVARGAFPPDLELKEGMRLRVRDHAGQELRAFVAEVRPEGVLLDFNPPLAGETLFFDVRITSLRPATQDELTHGQAHGGPYKH
jgi:FKBP-type peptidyl-prolyl cis-trans isomerase SlyD